MVYRRVFLFLCLYIFGFVSMEGQSSAQTASSIADQKPPFSFTHAVDFTVRNNGFVDMAVRYRGKLNEASALQAIGAYREFVNEHYFSFSVTEAATIKPDGRRVPIDPSKIMKQAAPGAAEALHFYADVATYTLLFPELAVGDEVEAVYVFTQKAPITTNGESRTWSFPRNVRRSAATVSVTAPRSANLRVWQSGLDHTWEETGDTVVHRLTFAARPFMSFQANVVDAFDFEPSFLLTTFKDWRAVADDFWTRGAAKSDPTPEVTALAVKLTSGLADETAKTKAIFDWVSGNVRYVNIVLGAGGWVPRESGAVLSNRFGDCKDHVTLTRALLRAVGIRADYALVNAASRYQAYALPAAQFDHIILYLPSLDRYIDPTNPNGEFDAQDLRLADKPVLRFNGEEAVYSRIPKVHPDRDAVTLDVDIAIAADGKATGTSTTTAFGSAVPLMRYGANSVRNAGLEEAATKALNAQNWRGKARYAVDGAMGKQVPAVVQARFELEQNFLSAGENTHRIPTGPRVFLRPHLELLKAIREERKEPFVCQPVRYEERVRISLPEGASFTSPPDAVAWTDPAARYEASYTIAQNTLEIRRLFVWNPSSPVCKVSGIAPTRRVLAARARDLNQSRLTIAVAGKTGKNAQRDADEN